MKFIAAAACLAFAEAFTAIDTYDGTPCGEMSPELNCILQPTQGKQDFQSLRKRTDRNVIYDVLVHEFQSNGGPVKVMLCFVAEASMTGISSGI